MYTLAFTHTHTHKHKHKHKSICTHKELLTELAQSPSYRCCGWETEMNAVKCGRGRILAAGARVGATQRSTAGSAGPELVVRAPCERRKLPRSCFVRDQIKMASGHFPKLIAAARRRKRATHLWLIQWHRSLRYTCLC